ncbi:MAG: hypothetical protein ING37_02335 [Rhodocyclaceae bacterium]|jgi:hypothetical protein|nr:hypothetical protein [Rhodocyclaceae bacterium]
MLGAILGPIAGALAGGLMGGDDSGQQQTATKEPWAPARKPLINSLNTGQELERYYQQNPFNAIQQTAYQNLFGDLDAFRGQNAGVMDFANRLMGTNYSRSGAPGQVGGMAGMLNNTMRQPPMGRGGMGAVSGLLGPGGGMGGMGGMGGGMGGGPFAVPQSRPFGLLDFAALNPYTSGAVKPTDKPNIESDEERIRRMFDEERARREAEFNYGNRGDGGA